MDDENQNNFKINADDLPTLFQIAVAQESNSNQIESLHTLFVKQQEEIDAMKETMRVQHEIIRRIVDEMEK